jgi:Tfp pilus assembly protein PilE
MDDRGLSFLDVVIMIAILVIVAVIAIPSIL